MTIKIVVFEKKAGRELDEVIGQYVFAALPPLKSIIYLSQDSGEFISGQVVEILFVGVPEKDGTKPNVVITIMSNQK